MKHFILIPIIVFLSFAGKSQHTFSIVAIDRVTGEIGSAGATCGDSIIWPGTKGALIISDIIPGVGAIHTQSYHNANNQSNAHTRMVMGDSPQDIIDWLTLNDISSDPTVRQYGIVDYNGGNPRSAVYTGINCFDYKNHILGTDYAIQGNILLGQKILDSMEARFNNTVGCLSDKLMAALQGANVIGADTRCGVEGTSSLSAFLRVAGPTDHPDTLFLDLNIAGTPIGIEPIDQLQSKYDNWKQNHVHNCGPLSMRTDLKMEEPNILVFPNPTDGPVTMDFFDNKVSNIEVRDINGETVVTMEFPEPVNQYQLDLSIFQDGIYIFNFFTDSNKKIIKKITLQNSK